jgi:hypothetical protein
VSDEAQDLAEAGHGQETAVLRICNLPYLAQDGGCQLGALEELDGNLACYDAQLLRVGLLEKKLEDALLFGRQVENGLVCAALAGLQDERLSGRQAHTQLATL